MPDFDLKNKVKEEGKFKNESKTLIIVFKLVITNLVLELVKSKKLLRPFVTTQ